MIKSRFSIPILATIFNLFFEYSLRGLNGFLENPFLIIFLSLVYFCWFTLLEDAIRRYKLNEKQIFLAPLVGIATLYSVMFIPSKAYYAQPLIFGINLGQFLWINLFWWTLLQTIMTMYFAVRLSPRTSLKPLLSNRGRVGVFGLWLLVGLLFRAQIGLPPLRFITYVSVAAIAVVAWKMVQRLQTKDFRPAKPSKVMDLLTGATVLVFLYSALRFHQPGLTDFHPINLDALPFIIKWTTFSGLVMLAHRFWSKKPWLV